MPTYQIVTGITVQKRVLNIPGRYAADDPYCVDDETDCCSATPSTPVDHGGGSAPPPDTNACCGNIAIPGTLYAITSGGTSNAAQFSGMYLPLYWTGSSWYSGVIDFGGNQVSILIACDYATCNPYQYHVQANFALCAVDVCKDATTCSPFLWDDTLNIVTFPACSGTLVLEITE